VVPTTDSLIIAEPEQQATDVKMNIVVAGSDTPQSNTTRDNIVETRTGELTGPLSEVDTADVPIRFSEKKRLHWAGKTCALNPLCEYDQC
jgi:tRNA-dihydrouridine synthase 3